jgi:hypothetical protein
MSCSRRKMELGIGGFVGGLWPSLLEEDGCLRRLLRHFAWRHGKAECSVAVFTRRGGERKRRRTGPRRGSYEGTRTRHERGGGGCMGCTWSGGGGRSADSSDTRWRAVTEPQWCLHARWVGAGWDMCPWAIMGRWQVGHATKLFPKFQNQHKFCNSNW